MLLPLFLNVWPLNPECRQAAVSKPAERVSRNNLGLKGLQRTMSICKLRCELDLTKNNNSSLIKCWG